VRKGDREGAWNLIVIIIERIVEGLASFGADNVKLRDMSGG
jgi:hypothetical protein